MDGLELIIQLRGGFGGLSSNVPLFTFWYYLTDEKFVCSWMGMKP